MGVTVLGIQHRVVALRKESVDRKPVGVDAACVACPSLSARRAWIESADVVSVQHGCESLSARRAWIERPIVDTSSFVSVVALRKESVDRKSVKSSYQLQP